MIMQRLPFIYFKDSDNRGRGVFTSEFIPIGTLIEICPVIILSQEDRLKIHETHLHDYYFLWDREGQQAAIALGFGSLYNHSFTPNAEYQTNVKDKTIDVYASQDILAGEEITFNYNGQRFDDSPLWFEVK